MEGRVFETFQKFFFSKFQKCPKSFPKVSKRVLNVFWGKLFENFYSQFSTAGRIFEIFQKKIFSKFQKCPKVFPNVSKRVLNMFWGKLFEKFLPSFPWNVESSKIFEKKYFQNSKNAQKCSQKYPNVFYGDFFEKNFCPVFHGGSDLRKFSKKIKKDSNFLKCPKSFPKVSKRVLNVFWGKLFEKSLPSVPWRLESSKIFLKIKKFSKFQNA